MKFCYNTSLPFLNNPKEQDLSYKTDLDLWGCFGKKKFCLITKEIHVQYTKGKYLLEDCLHMHTIFCSYKHFSFSAALNLYQIS